MASSTSDCASPAAACGSSTKRNCTSRQRSRKPCAVSVSRSVAAPAATVDPAGCDVPADSSEVLVPSVVTGSPSASGSTISGVALP